MCKEKFRQSKLRIKKTYPNESSAQLQSAGARSFDNYPQLERKVDGEQASAI